MKVCIPELNVLVLQCVDEGLKPVQFSRRNIVREVYLRGMLNISGPGYHRRIFATFTGGGGLQYQILSNRAPLAIRSCF